MRRVLARLQERGVASLAARAALPAGRGLLAFAERFALSMEEKAARLSRAEKSLLAPNAALKGIHREQPAFVIGNGPSLKNLDLAFLAGRNSFVLNGFWKHPQAAAIRPKYHFLADPNFFDASPASREFLKGLTACLPTNALFIPIEAHKAADLPPDRTRFVAFGPSLDRVPPRPPELDARIPRVINVAQLALMAALYMRCSPIVMLGFDHDWLAHRGRDTHFYEEPTLHAGLHELGQHPYRLLMECQLCLWKGYASLDLTARSLGCRIVNATEGGFLDVFERRPLKEMLA